MRSSMISGIGIGQLSSPAVVAAARTASTTSAEPRTPVIRSPRAATMCGEGGDVDDHVWSDLGRPDQRVGEDQPSFASVLLISTVVPP